MCKVQDLLDDGYTCNNSTLGGGVNKCLKVNDLITYFRTNNFNLSVPNRDGMRLFPKSKIVVNYPDMQWSEDGDWTVLSLDDGLGSYTENIYDLMYFGGDVTSITCSIIKIGNYIPVD